MTDARKPNIIFVFSDQQRADTMGCYGQPLPVTPNLDELAREGVLFEHAFTPQPVCGPARSCLQTGRYATETQCFRNGIALKPGTETVATVLSGSGYQVGYIGKWHLASTQGRASSFGLEPEVDYRAKAIPPERRGGYVDHWMVADVLEATSHGHGGGFVFDGDMQRVTFEKYRPDAITDFAVSYLESLDGLKPFFLFISYIEPHHQNDLQRYEGPVGSKERFKDYTVPGDLDGTRGDWRENYPDYLGCCWSIDANFKRIRDVLAARGFADNTVIIYASDHGSHFRTRNAEYKRSCHDASLRVPLIIHGPGFSGGLKVHQLVSLLDIPPTILVAGGVTPPGYMQGRPLQELVARTAMDWPDDVFAQISESQVGRAIRTSRWKYSVSAPGLNGNFDAASPYYLEEFLYDLEHDPHERENLVERQDLDAVRAELAGRLRRRMVQAGEKEPIILHRNRLAVPPERQIAGHICLDDDGTLVLVTVAVKDTLADPIQIPIVEVLEEFMGIPLVLAVGDDEHRGTVVAAGGEAVLLDPWGSTRPLKDVLLPVLPARVLALHPPGNRGQGAPQYELLFITETI